MPQTDFHTFDLLLGSWLVCGSTGFWQQTALRNWCAEDQRTRGGMARSAPIVKEGVPFHGLQKRRDIGFPNFHLKRDSHAVKRLQPLAFLVQVVLMQINESRNNDQAFCRNHAFAFKSRSRDFLDLALTNAAIANGIKTCFRIDYAAALNYKIVTLRQRRQRRKNNCQTQNETLHLRETSSRHS